MKTNENLEKYCDMLIEENTQLRKDWRIFKKENELLKKSNIRYKSTISSLYQYRNYWFNKYAKLFNKKNQINN